MEIYHSLSTEWGCVPGDIQQSGCRGSLVKLDYFLFKSFKEQSMRTWGMFPEDTAREASRYERGHHLENLDIREGVKWDQSRGCQEARGGGEGEHSPEAPQVTGRQEPEKYKWTEGQQRREGGSRAREERGRNEREDAKSNSNVRWVLATWRLTLDCLGSSSHSALHP